MTGNGEVGCYLDTADPIEWRVTIIRGDRFTFVADWTAGQRNEIRLQMVTD